MFIKELTEWFPFVWVLYFTLSFWHWLFSLPRAVSSNLFDDDEDKDDEAYCVKQDRVPILHKKVLFICGFADKFVVKPKFDTKLVFSKILVQTHHRGEACQFTRHFNNEIYVIFLMLDFFWSWWRWRLGVFVCLMARGVLCVRAIFLSFMVSLQPKASISEATGWTCLSDPEGAAHELNF